MPRDLRTTAIVLRRTNYGETDRILNLITPVGKFAVLARGVRKEKSRLAGAIELFTVSDVVIHEGRGNLAVLTSAKMLKFYGKILGDIAKLDLAANFLKRIERAAEQTDNPEFFDLLNQALIGLNQGIPPEIISVWFDFNFLRATGEEINLLRDVAGDALSPDQTYVWNNIEQALSPDPQGVIGANEIKLARLIWGAKLAIVAKVDKIEEILPKIASFVRE